LSSIPPVHASAYRPAYNLSFTHRGDLPLHAASVAVDDKAIVLAGPSRHGKTSLAAAFLADGHQMLSGDLTCVRIRGDGASIIPGPAGMRVRHDMVGQLDRAAVTELFRDADRAHFSLNPERRRTSSPVTLAGVVFLIDEAPEVALERLDPMRALPNLWHLSFHLPTQSERERKLRNLTDLAELAPAWELRRPWKVEALPQTVAGIVSTVIA
jgi:hypothetical protein